MRLDKLILAGFTAQNKVRKNESEKLIGAITSNPALSLEKAIEAYLPKKEWTNTFRRFIQRNKAVLEAVYRAKPEMGVDIVFKRKVHDFKNWINLLRLVKGQMYEVHQTPDKPSKKIEEGFTALLKERYFMLGFPYLIFEDGKKVDVCFGDTTVKAV